MKKTRPLLLLLLCVCCLGWCENNSNERHCHDSLLFFFVLIISFLLFIVRPSSRHPPSNLAHYNLHCAMPSLLYVLFVNIIGRSHPDDIPVRPLYRPLLLVMNHWLTMMRCNRDAMFTNNNAMLMTNWWLKIKQQQQHLRPISSSTHPISHPSIPFQWFVHKKWLGYTASSSWGTWALSFSRQRLTDAAVNIIISASALLSFTTIA